MSEGINGILKLGKWKHIPLISWKTIKTNSRNSVTDHPLLTRMDVTLCFIYRCGWWLEQPSTVILVFLPGDSTIHQNWTMGRLGYMSIIITLLNIMVHPFLRGDVLRCCLGNRLYLLYWHKRDHVNIVFRNFYPIKFHKMNLNRCLAPTVGTGHLSLY